MQSTLETRPTAPPATDDERIQPSEQGPGSVWPLAVLFLAFPLWWIFGVSSFIALPLALPMAVQLWRRRQIVAPGGLGWWLIFLVWVALGVFTLFVDAPGAAPGGGLSRLLVFGYRLSWYLAATILLLWLANSSRRAITFHRVANLVGWLFVFCVVGGLLGVFASGVQFRSVLELILPHSIGNNVFVKSLIHPGIADIQDVLGRPEARPKAPFAFANTWGSCISLSLPFFLVGWLRQGRRWQRIASLPILALAAIPIVYSLNRGLWVSLLVGLIFFGLLQVSRGKPVALFVSVIVIAIGFVALVASPLGSLINDRLEHQHSNDRRGQLLEQTVWSATTGSPVIGFGSTRDVQGSFFSIAGASTPDCKACGVPPLGTQGHLWLVIFSQGLLGAVFFLSFFLVSFFRSWRCRSTPEVVATCVLLFFVVQIFVYDTPEYPLYIVMMAIALAWREQSRSAGSDTYLIRVSTLRAYFDNLIAARRLIAVGMVAGLLAGTAVAFSLPRTYSAQEMIMLAPSPSHLVTGIAEDQSPKEITIDTEAALVLSEGTLRRVREPNLRTNQLRAQISVTAQPNTSVLVLDVRDRSPERAERLVTAIASAYLDARREYLLQRRSQVLADLRIRYAELEALGLANLGNQLTGSAARGAVAAEMESVDQAINDIVLTRTSAGEVLRTDAPVLRPREFGLWAGSGLALGLLAALGVMVYRHNRSRLRTLAKLGLISVGGKASGPTAPDYSALPSPSISEDSLSTVRNR